jgi:hypothetical protein
MRMTPSAEPGDKVPRTGLDRLRNRRFERQRDCCGLHTVLTPQKQLIAKDLAQALERMTDAGLDEREFGGDLGRLWMPQG